jgi:hypothetical protein
MNDFEDHNTLEQFTSGNTLRKQTSDSPSTMGINIATHESMMLQTSKYESL